MVAGFLPWNFQHISKQFTQFCFLKFKFDVDYYIIFFLLFHVDIYHKFSFLGFA